MFALARYDSVARALKDAGAFSSASGVMMNDRMNPVLRGNTLCNDGVDHQRLRRIVGKPLSPTALNSLKSEITAKAELLVDRLVGQGQFCAVTVLATATQLLRNVAMYRLRRCAAVARAECKVQGYERIDIVDEARSLEVRRREPITYFRWYGNALN